MKKAKKGAAPKGEEDLGEIGTGSGTGTLVKAGRCVGGRLLQATTYRPTGRRGGLWAMRAWLLTGLGGWHGRLDFCIISIISIISITMRRASVSAFIRSGGFALSGSLCQVHRNYYVLVSAHDRAGIVYWNVWDLSPRDVPNSSEKAVPDPSRLLHRQDSPVASRDVRVFGHVWDVCKV